LHGQRFCLLLSRELSGRVFAGIVAAAGAESVESVCDVGVWGGRAGGAYDVSARALSADAFAAAVEFHAGLAAGARVAVDSVLSVPDGDGSRAGAGSVCVAGRS